MEDKIDKMVIFVSGNRFEVDIEIILTFPTTRLGKIAAEMKIAKREVNMPFYFNRPVSSFEAIIAYYQTGQLHIPTNVCPMAFKLELDFWGLNTKELEKCCLYKYLAAMDDFQTTDEFSKSLKATSLLKYGSTKLTYIRDRIWAIIDNREQTVIAKVYLVTSVIFLMISILSLAFSTLPVSRQSVSNCELKKYITENEDGLDPGVLDFLNSIPCNSLTAKLLMDYATYWEDYWNWTENGTSNGTSSEYSADFVDYSADVIPSQQTISAIKKFKLPSKSKVHPVFLYLDYIGISFFTIELLLRLITCPSWRKYFCSVLNIIEIVVLIAAYINIFIDELILKLRYEVKGVEILQYLQMFRVLRLFRVMSNVTSMRVLCYALKSGYKDILVLFMYVFIGIVLFSNFLYFAEDTTNISSIPEAWWWGIITMTTVGYGDIAPKSPIGRLIGGVCALSGVVLLSLIIPVFVNTFINLYQFAKLHDKFISEEKAEVSAQDDTEKTVLSRVKVAPFEISDVKVSPFDDKYVKMTPIESKNGKVTPIENDKGGK